VSFPKHFWLLLALEQDSVDFSCLPEEFSESWSVNSLKQKPLKRGGAALWGRRAGGTLCECEPLPGCDILALEQNLVV